MAGINSLEDNNQPLIEDFPESARTALVYLLQDLRNKYYLASDGEVILELNRIGRFTSKNI